jgi:hypothetical protein
MHETSIVDLTAESIKDYQTCALLYQFRNIDDLYEPIPSRDLMSLKYENTLKKLAAFFFYKRQGGIVPSMSAILNRWEKLWFPKEVSAYDIAVEKHESIWGNLSSMNTKAVNCIMKFYEDFSLDIKDPLLINENFTVGMSRDIRVSGVFDLVLRDPKSKKISVIKWLASPKRPNLSTLSMDFTILKYAFENKNQGKDLDIDFYAYDLGSNKNGFTQIDITDSDINNLIYWSEEISSAKVFPPRRGLTYYCKKCPFDSPCRDFCITNDMVVDKKDFISGEQYYNETFNTKEK